jgi:hypothetical protein
MCFSPNLKVLVILSHALTYVFILCIAMEASVANIEALDQPLICGDFDSKLEHLK